MIKYKTGNIFDAESEALVNTVNCVGVMGRGLALQFKKAYPDNFQAYATACKRQQMLPGHVFTFETGELTAPRFIINFPTKRHWRGASRMADIESGLVSLVGEIAARNIKSIAIPPLGSGLGGLRWEEVRTRIEHALAGLSDLRVVVYEPQPTVQERPVRNREVPAMTPGRAALVALMHRYLCMLLDPFFTLLEAHKIMYFMQVAGEPLRLEYKKGPYGPYATNLRHVLNKIEGHFISGYADGGDNPEKPLALVPGAIEDARAFLQDNPATQRRLEKVTQLIEGFESSLGLELLSTVHWVACKQSPSSIDDVIAKTHAWNKRKKQFSPRQIRLAVETLQGQGWIQAGWA